MLQKPHASIKQHNNKVRRRIQTFLRYGRSRESENGLDCGIRHVNELGLETRIVVLQPQESSNTTIPQ